MLRNRVLAALAAVIALSVIGSTAGCSDSPQNASKRSANGLNGLKRTEFAFDNYRGVDVAVIDYARQHQVDLCLAEAGFPQNLRAGAGQPFPATSPFSTTPDQFGLVSAEQARLKGFGKDPGWTPPRMAGADKNYEKTAESCQATAWSKLPSGTEQVFVAYQALGNELLPYRADVDNRLPKDLSRKMLDCIKSKGWSVPDEQQFLRTPQPQVMGVTLGDYVGGSSDWAPDPRRKGIQVQPPVPPRRYQPTPEESKLAVAWYHCQQDTGWTKTQLQIAADVQWEYIEERAERLVELNPKIEAAAKQAAKIVGRK